MSIKIEVVLVPEAYQIQLLLATIDRYSEMCNYISEIVFLRDDIKPINLFYWDTDPDFKNFYYQVQAFFRDINTNLITLALRKVAKAYKKKRPAECRKFSGVLDYSKYLLSIMYILPPPDNIGMLTIATLSGRQKMHFTFDDAQREALSIAFNGEKYREYELTYRENKFYLSTRIKEYLVH